VRLVLVRWVDAHGLPGWRGPAEMDEFVADADTCASVGFVYREDDRAIVLYASATSYGTYADITKIPRSALLSLEELGEWEVEASDAG
jgi:hypothetical protein